MLIRFIVGGNMARILVVEDDMLVGKMVQRTLSRRGHEVIVVGDGRTGLKTACADKFDLIITDLRMPGMDGFDLLGRLRDEHISTPAILITACIDKTIDEVASSLGIVALLVKPFQKERLLESLNSALLSAAR